MKFSKQELASVLLTVFMVALLAIGAMLFAVNPVTAYAADGANDILVLNEADDFVVTGTTLTGLSETGRDKIAVVGGSTAKNYKIVVPTAAKAIDKGAFQNETSLVGVELHSGVTSVGALAFAGCSNLADLSFGNCRLAGKIYDAWDFTPDDLSLSKLSIGQKAFADCTSLSTLFLPTRLNQMGYGAFSGCLNIKYIYISNITFNEKISNLDGDMEDDGSLTYFPTHSGVIYDGYVNYASSSLNSAVYTGLTYIIKVNVSNGYAGGEVAKLFGHDYDYVMDNEGNWSTVEGTTPFIAQEDYKTSVWYDSSDWDNANVIDLDIINEKLHQLGQSDFIVCARYFNVPTLAAKQLEFSGMNYDVNTRLGSLISIVSEPDELEISHLYVKKATYNGSETNSVYNAGRYELTINLNPELGFGEWENDIIVDLTVAKCVIDVSNYNHFRWWLSDYRINLNSGTLYEYSYQENNILKYYYSVSTLDNAPEPEWKNWEYIRTFNVTAGIAFDSNADNMTVEITGLYADSNAYTVQYGENVRSGLGKFSSNAVVAPTENYEFIISDSSLLSARGMTATKDNATGNLIVVKEWYVVKNEKVLLNYEESIAQGEEVEYKLPSWTFGSLNDSQVVQLKAQLAKPALQHFNLDKFEYKFTLLRTDGDNNEEIVSSMVSSKWEYYINPYMPAGRYTVTINSESVHVGNHTHWWNNEEHKGEDFNFAAVACTLYFDVYEGSFVLDDAAIKGGAAVSVDLALMQNNNNYNPFFAMILGGFGGQTGAVVRNYITAEVALANSEAGYWKENANTYFAQAPVFTFNLERMHNNVYRTANDPEWANYINASEMTREYRVYYRASVKNYKSIPEVNGDGARYDRYYTINVYREIQAPTLDRTEFTYSGRMLTANYSSAQPEDRYRYIVIDNSNIDAGSYEAKAILEDKVHYRWAANDYKTNDAGDLLLPYTIAKYVVTVPVLSPMYYSGSEIPVDISVDELGDNEIFSVTHDRRYEKLTFTEVGTYDITLKLEGEYSKNCVWNGYGEDVDEIVVTFEIMRAINDWAVPVGVANWQWQKFNAVTNRFTAAALDGKVTYFVTDSESITSKLTGLDNIELVESGSRSGLVSQAVEDRLNNLPVGTYWLWAIVADQTANYTSLTAESFQFEITPAQNSWVQVPSVVRWKWDEYDAELNAITGEAEYGTVMFSILKSGSLVRGLESFTDYLSVMEALRNLDAGTYTLHAQVEDDTRGNYVGLNGDDAYVEDFRVLQMQNHWVRVPESLAWTYLQYNKTVDLFTAEPAYGNMVRFSISLNGEPLDGKLGNFTSEEVGSDTLTELLTNLHAGTYTLRAYVPAHATNYTELDSPISLRVFTADNYWSETPSIVPWTWGHFNSAVNVVKGAPEIGNQNDVLFSIFRQGSDVAENGLGNFTLATQNLANLLEDLPAGHYRLVATYDTGSDDYEKLDHEIEFEVVQATNYWEQTPNIARWIAGVEMPKLPTGKPWRGDVHYVITSVPEAGQEGIVYYDGYSSQDQAEINNLADAPAGWYKMIASVEGDDNYTGLSNVEVEFRVFEPDTEIFNVAKQNAIDSLQFYAMLNNVAYTAEMERRINECQTLNQISNALDWGKSIVDAAVFAREKANALLSISEFELTYGVKLDASKKSAVENAKTETELSTALSSALTELSTNAVENAKTNAISAINAYQTQTGLNCDADFETRINNSYSVEVINALRDEAIAQIDSRLRELNIAKAAAIETLKAYFKGKGIKYTDEYAAEINAATSLSGVQYAYSVAVENAPAGNEKKISGLTAGLVVVIVLALAVGGFLAYIMIARKIKLDPSKLKKGGKKNGGNDDNNGGASGGNAPQADNAAATASAQAQNAQQYAQAQGQAQYSAAQTQEQYAATQAEQYAAAQAQSAQYAQQAAQPEQPAQSVNATAPTQEAPAQQAQMPIDDGVPAIDPTEVEIPIDTVRSTEAVDATPTDVIDVE